MRPSVDHFTAFCCFRMIAYVCFHLTGVQYLHPASAILKRCSKCFHHRLNCARTCLRCADDMALSVSTVAYISMAFGTLLMIGGTMAYVNVRVNRCSATVSQIPQGVLHSTSCVSLLFTCAQKGSVISLVAGLAFGAIIGINGLMMNHKNFLQPVVFNTGAHTCCLSLSLHFYSQCMLMVMLAQCCVSCLALEWASECTALASSSRLAW